MRLSLPKMVILIIALLTALQSAVAQEAPRPQPVAFSLPDNVSLRKATIWPAGTRMAADVYTPKGASGKLPTIIMAYGWGGTMARFRPEAAAFAEAGYLVVMFDYR